MNFLYPTLKGKGGESGDFRLEAPSKTNDVISIHEGGEGGENSLRLIGNYYREHLFASFRSNISHQINNIKNLDDNDNLTAPNLVYSGLINFLSFFIMPISRLMSNHWYQGPFKIEAARADRGKDNSEQFLRSQSNILFVSSFDIYMSEIKSNIKIIYPESQI